MAEIVKGYRLTSKKPLSEIDDHAALYAQETEINDAVAAVIEAARNRAEWAHNHSCSWHRGRGEACGCGRDELVASLSRLDALEKKDA